MSVSVMQTVQAKDYGGPEVLTPVQVPVPEPNPDQVLIQLKAAGVNPADWKIRAGYFKQFMPLQLPWTPGMEGAGLVQAVGGKSERGTLSSSCRSSSPGLPVWKGQGSSRQLEAM